MTSHSSRLTTRRRGENENLAIMSENKDIVIDKRKFYRTEDGFAFCMAKKERMDQLPFEIEEQNGAIA